MLNRLQELLEEYTNNSISESRFNELCQILKTTNDTELNKLFETGLQSAAFKQMNAQKLRRMLNAVLNKEQLQLVTEEEADSSEPLVVNIKSNLWKRIAVAASVIFIIGLGIYILSVVEGRNKKELSVVEVPADVPAPDKNRAQIKLADGSILYLDSAANGELVNSDGISVTKTADGKIVYTPSADPERSRTETPTAVQYNTLMNPRGSIVMHMTLSDGSQVWLNAGSSITYPVVFTGNERKVSIDGEAYFEVAKFQNPNSKFPNQRMPFIVEKGNMQVQVLGTHFNVNAYNDEKDIKVTLVEGSVRVSNDVDAKTIKPGQQAVILSGVEGSPLTIHHSPDLEQILAWKNNDFIFQDDTLESIMRQLARWYNINPIFTNQSAPSNSTNYTGRITRTVPISEVLAMFEKLGYVKFQINGNDVKIIPVR